MDIRHTWRRDSIPPYVKLRTIIAIEIKRDQPMRKDFFPDREADMIDWGRNVIDTLTAAEGHYGVPPDQLAAITEAFVVFEQAYAVASQPATRTQPAVAAKNAGRKLFERQARLLSQRLKANADLSDQDRIDLGINVPKPRRQHVNPPESAPVVQVKRIDGNRATIRLRNLDNSATRALPDTAVGATILWAVGDRPPLNPDGWHLATDTTRTELTLTFDPALPAGTPVHVVALWKSRRNEFGPPATPTRFRLGEPSPNFTAPMNPFTLAAG